MNGRSLVALMLQNQASWRTANLLTILFFNNNIHHHPFILMGQHVAMKDKLALQVIVFKRQPDPSLANFTFFDSGRHVDNVAYWSFD